MVRNYNSKCGPCPAIVHRQNYRDRTGGLGTETHMHVLTSILDFGLAIFILDRVILDICSTRYRRLPIPSSSIESINT